MRSFLSPLWVRALVALIIALAYAGVASADELTLSVPAIGVVANVEQVSIVDGNLGAPVMPDDVGVLSLQGNLLVVGHRDWEGRLRAFAHLPDLQHGDTVLLSDGREYSVESVDVWDIDGEQDLWVAVSSSTDGDMLTLISCTGPFSLSRHEYLQRIVVRAGRII